MSFGAPQYLILLPLLFLVGWYFKQLSLWRPLRALFILLLIGALCDPLFRLRSDSMDLWVLFDRSSSAQEMVEAGEEEWKSLLLRSKPGRENRLHFVDYATDVIPGANAETNQYSGSQARPARHPRRRRSRPARHRCLRPRRRPSRVAAR